MARTLGVAAHARRRNEFLDAAQRLIETKGYEQMSVQDVLDDLGTSRGAFYHYFGSKQELLWAVVERVGEGVASHLTPIAADPDLPAVDKLRRLFAELAAWNEQRREVLVTALRVWYSDGNALVRQKVRTGIIGRLAYLLGGIISQGVREGVFIRSDPEPMSRVVATLIQDLNDELADQFFAYESGDADMATIERTVAAYTSAMERILGAPEGSVVLAEMTMLRAWFDPHRNQNGEP